LIKLISRARSPKLKDQSKLILIKLNSLSKHSTRSNSHKYGDEIDPEMQKELQKIKFDDKNKPEINIEIDSFFGGSGNP